MKIPKIKRFDAVYLNGYIYVEKITDKYDDIFPFSRLTERLDLVGYIISWINIDNLGFLSIRLNDSVYKKVVNGEINASKMLSDFVYIFNEVIQ